MLIEQFSCLLGQFIFVPLDFSTLFKLYTKLSFHLTPYLDHFITLETQSAILQFLNYPKEHRTGWWRDIIKIRILSFKNQRENVMCLGFFHILLKALYVEVLNS